MSETEPQYLQVFATTWGTTAIARKVAFEDGGLGVDTKDFEMGEAEKQVKEMDLTEVCRAEIEQDGHILGVIFSVQEQDLRVLRDFGRHQLQEMLVKDEYGFRERDTVEEGVWPNLADDSTPR